MNRREFLTVLGVTSAATIAGALGLIPKDVLAAPEKIDDSKLIGWVNDYWTNANPYPFTVVKGPDGLQWPNFNFKSLTSPNGNFKHIVFTAGTEDNVANYFPLNNGTFMTDHPKVNGQFALPEAYKPTRMAIVDTSNTYMSRSVLGVDDSGNFVRYSGTRVVARLNVNSGHFE